MMGQPRCSLSLRSLGQRQNWQCDRRRSRPRASPTTARASSAQLRSRRDATRSTEAEDWRPKLPVSGRIKSRTRYVPHGSGGGPLPMTQPDLDSAPGTPSTRERMSNPLPTTHRSRQPTTDNRQPTTDNRQPTTDNRKPLPTNPTAPPRAAWRVLWANDQDSVLFLFAAIPPSNEVPTAPCPLPSDCNGSTL